MDNNAAASHAQSVFASLHRRKTTDLNNAGSAKSTEIRDTASRDARRYLLQVVRNDWSFEPDPSTLTTSPPFASSIPPERLRGVREWLPRDQDTSDSEVDNETAKKDDSNSNPYRFESPDAIESSLIERKRKRRKLIQDEMEWNEGLRLWMQRRDAWSGAKMSSPSPSNPASTGLEVGLESNKASRKSTSSDGSRVVSYNGSNDTDIVDATSQSSVQHETPSTLPTDTFRGEDDASTKDKDNPALTAAAPTPKDSDLFPETLVPVLPPILPDSNPIRASINPAVYAAIYSRLVIQSHAPAVPINLSHMTRALVQGWKSDGEWPPRPTATRDVPVLKKQAKSKANREQINNDKKNAAKKSGVAGVSNAVKKVLGLSSFHPGHRLHIRANSQNGSAAAAAAATPRVPDETPAKF